MRESEQREKKREEKERDLPFADSVLKSPKQPSLAQAEARSQDLCLGFPQVLEHHLLPRRMHMSRKLEPDTPGCRDPKWHVILCTNMPAHPPLLICTHRGWRKCEENMWEHWNTCFLLNKEHQSWEWGLKSAFDRTYSMLLQVKCSAHWAAMDNVDCPEHQLPVPFNF